MAGFGIPKAFASTGLEGAPIFFDGEILSIPGTPVTIFSIVIGAGVAINLSQLNCSCQFSGVFTVEKNAVVIATTRARAGRLDPFFSWLPARPVVEGDTIVVKYQQRAASPAVLVQAYLMGAQQT
jgi:hypothetical protein